MKLPTHYAYRLKAPLAASIILVASAASMSAAEEIPTFPPVDAIKPPVEVPETIVIIDGGGGWVPDYSSPFPDRGGGGVSAPEQETDDRQGICPGAGGGAPSAESAGNPVVYYTGNKVEPEQDFVVAGEMGLYLRRVYNHQWSASGIFGDHWLSNFDYSLAFSSGDSIAWIQRPDGSRLKYVRDVASGRWRRDMNSPSSYIVKETNGSYTLHGHDRGTETYNADGYITQLKNEQGVFWNFTYTNKYLQKVTHSSGRSVSFTWNNGLLAQVTDPAGNAYRYTYATNVVGIQRARLASTTLPGTPETVISYHYEDARYPGGLSGKSFNGSRYSTFKYDALRRAVSTEHAGGIEKYEFEYAVQSSEVVVPPPAPVVPGGRRINETDAWCEYKSGATRFCYDVLSVPAARAAAGTETPPTKSRPVRLTTTVKNPYGRKSTYAYEDGRQVSVAGAASPKCPASYQEQTYDSNGFRDLVSDFESNITDFDYDAKGRLLKRVEAVETPAARTVLWTWNADDRVTTETVVGDIETTYTYDSRGNITKSVRRNLASVGGNVSHTTTVAYTYHSNGLKASVKVDGPLSKDDVTSVYDSKGDLVSITNGLGQVTTYANYNGLGLAGRVTGPNGDVMEATYDARGRTSTRRVKVGNAWATTSIAYNGVGDVSTVKTPDGVTTQYQYDAGRRLISEIRPLENGTFAWTRHTYDNASNRTKTQLIHRDYSLDSFINGAVEGVVSDSNWNWFIEGWACATGSSGSVQVQARTAAGALVSGTANLASDSAIGQVCQSGGAAHRYRLPISLDQRQRLGGQAINVVGMSPLGSEHDKTLAGSGAYVVPPAGVTGDAAHVPEKSPGVYALAGWSCAIGVSSPSTVRIYAGGPPGQGALIGSVVGVLVPNDDVKQACQSTGAYWFELSLDNAIRAAHGGKALHVVAESPQGNVSGEISRSGTHRVPTLNRSAELIGFTPGNSHIMNGESTSVTLQLRNTGNYVWNPGEMLVAWGATTLNQHHNLPGPVSPGGVLTMNWTVAPYHNGVGVRTYGYMAQLMSDGAAWGPKANVHINVENGGGYCPPNKPYCYEPMRVQPGVSLELQEGAR